MPFPYARISTASLSICSSVKPGLRLTIFSSCASESANRALEWLRGLRVKGKTNSVCDAIGEAHELYLVFRALPVRIESENEAESGRLGVCRGVRERDVSQSRCGAVDHARGTHGGR